MLLLDSPAVFDPTFDHADTDEFRPAPDVDGDEEETFDDDDDWPDEDLEQVAAWGFKGGLREIPNGAFHAGVTRRYRVDGVDEYTIEYRSQSDGTYKIFAPACPADPYGRGPSVHHRYSSGEICVLAGREPRTLDRAIAIASLWMKNYSRYIRTGTMDNSGARVDV